MLLFALFHTTSPVTSFTCAGVFFFLLLPSSLFCRIASFLCQFFFPDFKPPFPLFSSVFFFSLFVVVVIGFLRRFPDVHPVDLLTIICFVSALSVFFFVRSVLFFSSALLSLPLRLFSVFLSVFFVLFRSVFFCPSFFCLFVWTLVALSLVFGWLALFQSTPRSHSPCVAQSFGALPPPSFSTEANPQIPNRENKHKSRKATTKKGRQTGIACLSSFLPPPLLFKDGC